MRTDIQSGALFNRKRTRRYLLWRRWEFSGPRVTWVCLNPSTADELVNDHSVTKMIGFAKDSGFSAIDVVNLFDFMATKPEDLYGKKITELTSPMNDTQIRQSCRRSAMVICAWGGHGVLLDRDKKVIKILVESATTKYKLHALKFNNDGTPAHPLMLPYILKPVLITEWTRYPHV